MKVTAITRELETARAEFDSCKRLTNASIANVVYLPLSPGAHLLGLAAYAAFLVDLHGWNDPDWLRRQ